MLCGARPTADSSGSSVSSKAFDQVMVCSDGLYALHRKAILPHTNYFERHYTVTEDADGNLLRKAYLDDDFQDVRRMFRFFYKNDYDDSVVFPYCCDSCSPNFEAAPIHNHGDTPAQKTLNNIVCDARMYAIACKYEIASLENLAKGRLEAAFLIDIKDTNLPGGAVIAALYRGVVLPRSDTFVRKLLVDLWPGGGAQDDEPGDDTAKQFYELITGRRSPA